MTILEITSKNDFDTLTNNVQHKIIFDTIVQIIKNDNKWNNEDGVLGGSVWYDTIDLKTQNIGLALSKEVIEIDVLVEEESEHNYTVYIYAIHSNTNGTSYDCLIVSIILDGIVEKTQN